MTEEKPVDEIPLFAAPVIQDNPQGWGPFEMPDQFRDMPYQPFSKGDRLGKISDWTGAAFQDKKYASKSPAFISKLIYENACLINRQICITIWFGKSVCLLSR